MPYRACRDRSKSERTKHDHSHSVQLPWSSAPDRSCRWDAPKQSGSKAPHSRLFSFTKLDPKASASQQILTCLGYTMMKNRVIDEDAQQEPEQSVANRVLSTFITAVGEDEGLSEGATPETRLAR